MNNRKWTSVFEWAGSALVIVYALLIASNTGNDARSTYLIRRCFESLYE